MLNPNLHRQIMLQILKEIYSQPSLASNLGFKGGTAAYLLYNLSRFSVDLDFDLLEIKKETEVFSRLTKIISKFGRLDQAINKKNTLFYLISYQTGLQKLKIEISKRPSWSNYEIKQFLGIPLLVMVRKDMFAHKLVALSERKQLANRDLFDIYFFLKNRWPINIELVEKRTKIKFVNYLKKCIKMIENVSAAGILANMGELIDNQNKAWVKNHLKNELLTLLKILLNSTAS